MKTVHLMAFSTSNYEAMKEFFANIGFSIDERRSPLTPLFETGRAAYVQRGELAFNLEESENPYQKAQFNLMLCDYDEAEIDRLKASDHHYEYGTSPYGQCYTLYTPDGGTILIT